MALAVLIFSEGFGLDLQQILALVESISHRKTLLNEINCKFFSDLLCFAWSKSNMTDLGQKFLMLNGFAVDERGHFLLCKEHKQNYLTRTPTCLAKGREI